MGASARCRDQRTHWAPTRHTLAPDQRTFPQLTGAPGEDELLDRHLDQLAAAEVHVPQGFVAGRDGRLPRGCGRKRTWRARALDGSRHAFVVNQTRLLRSTATSSVDRSYRGQRAQHVRRVFFVFFVHDLDRWRWCGRAALGERAIEPHELATVTTQHAKLSRLLAVRHMTPAAAVAVDLMQSAHRGPGSIPPASEPARALSGYFFSA